MASLEELLAREGFKTGKLRQGTRSSTASRAVSMPLYPTRQQNPMYHEGLGDRKGRAFARRSRSMLPETGGARAASARNSLVWNRHSTVDGRREDMIESKGSELRYSHDYGGSSQSGGRPKRDGKSREDKETIHRHSDAFRKENGGCKQRNMMNFTNDERSRNKNTKNLQAKHSFNEDGQGRRRDAPGSSGSEPALDEAAIQAVISILTSYIRRFFKDENFRASIRRRSCASRLDSGAAEETNHKDSGVVANLKEAIATIERVVKVAPDPKELKKTSLKLAVITGFSSSDLKDGYTSGIPNSDLAACAHLYLGVIYKFQKKDRVSAKHLLQVFCESPRQARTTLLPALWDHLVFPHLSHLRAWYEKEAESIPRTSSRLRKMKLLEKVYNDALDNGTYQFAVYYKDWITEEKEPPALPSIHAPSEPLPVFLQEDSNSHVAGSDGVSSSRSSMSSRLMVSRSLYESMFSQPRKTEAADEMKSKEEEEEQQEELNVLEGEEDDEAEEEQFITPIRKELHLHQKNEEAATYSPKSGINVEEHRCEDHSMSSSHLCSSNVTMPSDILQADEWTAKKYHQSSRFNIAEKKEFNVHCENVESCPSFSRATNAPCFVPQGKENELTLNEVEGEEDDEAEEEKFVTPIRKELHQKYEEAVTYSPKSGINVEEHRCEDHSMSSANVTMPSDILKADEWTAKKYHQSSRFNIPEKQEPNVHCENVESWPSFSGGTNAPCLVPQAKENEFTLKRLAQVVFQPQVAGRCKDTDPVSLIHPARLPVYDLHQKNLTSERSTASEMKTSGTTSTISNRNSCELRSSAGSFGKYDYDIDQGSFFSSIPKEFLCPLMDQLFSDPVTLETGHTFERAAIKEWFDQGNRKCPVTGRALECLSVPITNFVLKRVIDGWKSEHCRNLLVLATQIAGNAMDQGHKSKDELALFIIEQLLTSFSTEEQMENAKHLISLGGLHFLTRRFELGNLEEKTRLVPLLLCCIKADGHCRSYLAMNVKGPCILELLHSRQVGARSNAVLLLIELICLNRRTDVTSFLSGLHTEAIVNTMHVLLVHLQSSQPEERALVAVLILHFDLMVEPRRYSIYREEAVDGIVLALECCLSDEKVIANSHRALLMLGGHFSLAGETLIENWLLKQAGFFGESGTIPFNHIGEIDEDLVEEEEAMAREEWLKNMTLVLLGNGKRSLLETLSKCLGSGNPDLVRVCLTTAAWLSHALASVSVAEFELSAFSAFAPWLKKHLENGEQIEHRVFASISLLNFSMIPECRVLLMTLAEEMCDPLRSLLEVTWTAKQLYDTITTEHPESTGERGISYKSSYVSTANRNLINTSCTTKLSGVNS